MIDFLTRLRVQNATRKVRWHGPDTEEWSLADWSNAMQGEAGEVGDVIKKIRRAQTRTGPQTMADVPALLEELDHEMADTLIYLDLLDSEANALRRQLGLPESTTLVPAVVRKFNIVSDKQGFPEKLYVEDEGEVAHLYEMGSEEPVATISTGTPGPNDRPGEGPHEWATVNDGDTTLSCAHGCGAWMGPHRSGPARDRQSEGANGYGDPAGPGTCPLNPIEP
jgi:NTP pyrophosphatase (non-canonical NTP hydrolase)